MIERPESKKKKLKAKKQVLLDRFVFIQTQGWSKSIRLLSFFVNFSCFFTFKSSNTLLDLKTQNHWWVWLEGSRCYVHVLCLSLLQLITQIHLLLWLIRHARLTSEEKRYGKKIKQVIQISEVWGIQLCELNRQLFKSSQNFRPSIGRYFFCLV